MGSEAVAIKSTYAWPVGSEASVEPEVPGKGLRVGDPVPESPALARTSVKPEVPWDYVRGVFLLVRPTPMFGSEATIVVPSLPCLGRGAPVLTPFMGRTFKPGRMSVRTAEAGYQLFVAVSRPLKSPNVPILP